MCLFPGGGMNMQPIVPPTPAALKHKNILYLVMLVHVILAIMLMFMSVFSGIFELVTVMILWCGTAQMNFCYLQFYILMCMFSFLTYFTTLGLWI